MAVSMGLPTKGKEEIGGEDIPSKENSNSLACQSFKEALFGLFTGPERL